jgi:hypothetical protein
MNYPHSAVSIEMLTKIASDLASNPEDPNSEYDRALVEIVCIAAGLSTDEVRDYFADRIL